MIIPIDRYKLDIYIYIYTYIIVYLYNLVHHVVPRSSKHLHTLHQSLAQGRKRRVQKAWNFSESFRRKGNWAGIQRLGEQL
jgi:hypothetical protein